MAKIAATFEQQHADAVVSELGRMNVDGLDWRVHGQGDGSDTGAVPFAGLPAGMAGNGVRTADGGPAVVPPFFATGSNDLNDGVGDSEEDFLSQARDRGATVIVVEAPDDMQETIRQLFDRHGASNLTVG
jgi:hypothetical protein